MNLKNVFLLLGYIFAFFFVCFLPPGSLLLPYQFVESRLAPVSYTHLDVYKRQMESFGVQAEYFLPRYEEAVEAAVIQYNTNVRYFSSKEETRENSSTPGSADAPAGSAVTLPPTDDQIIRTTDPEEIRQWIDQSIPRCV